MRKLYCLSILLLSVIITVNANGTYKTKDLQFKKIANVDLQTIKKDWAPKLVNLEAPFPGHESYRHYLELIKQDIKAKKDYSNVDLGQHKTNSADLPLVNKHFMGNDYDFSVPCDNDIAVSNDRKVVSVVNSTIYMFDGNTDSLLLDISLDAFADTLALTGTANNKYDPKVAYDPDEDRFIIVFLNSSQDSNKTKIIVGFSQSNDPTAEWNVYAIDGNPLSTHTWSDFPMIALTNDEFFITVNSIGVNEPWQTGFKQTFIWQVDKYSGYNGSVLESRLYHDIYFGNKPVRNLCPIQGGSGLTGPGIYLLSNRNFAMTNDTIFLYQVTGIMDEPGTTLTSSYLISDRDYGAPPNAWQVDKMFDIFLSTNDARILSGYIEGDQIHFVGNTAAYTPDTVRAAIFHGRIRTLSSNPYVESNIITDDVLDFGYPNISYSGRFDGDDQAIISYNHTADSIWPGFSATFWNIIQGYSGRLEIKKGESPVYILSSQYQRWGDYSGSQRLYNEAGVVWVSGFYGGTSKTNPGQTNVNLTWIAELESPWSPSSSIEDVSDSRESKIFPNPLRERFILKFENDLKRRMTFSVYDSEGQLQRLLLEEIVKEGENVFSFNMNALAAGVYFLVIADDEGEVMSEKVVVQ